MILVMMLVKMLVMMLVLVNMKILVLVVGEINSVLSNLDGDIGEDAGGGVGIGDYENICIVIGNNSDFSNLRSSALL